MVNHLRDDSQGHGGSGGPPPFKGGRVLRTLTDIFTPGSAPLAEGLRTLVVSPDRFIEPGMEVRASFSFTNLGGSVAKGLRVRFARPDNLTYVDGSAHIDGAPLDTAAGAALLAGEGADLGAVDPGAQRHVGLIFAVAPTAENGAVIELQSALCSNDIPVIGSNVVRLIVRSKPVLQNAESRLSLLPVREAVPGGELLLAAKIRNAGHSSANDVSLVMPPPAGTSYVADSVRVGGQPVAERPEREPFGYSNPIVVANRLMPGATVDVQYRVRIDSPPPGATIVASGAAASREVAEFEFERVSLTIASSASFEGPETHFDVLTGDGIAGPDEVVPGQRLQLRSVVRNVGSGVAEDMAVTVELPPGLAYSPGSLRVDDMPYPLSGLDAPGKVALGGIEPLATRSMSLEAIVSTPAPSGRPLRIQSTLGWLGGARSFERTLTVASQPRFSSGRNRLALRGPAVVHPGEEISYVLNVVNDGTIAAPDAVLHLRGDDALERLELFEDGERRPPGEALSLGTLEPQIARTLSLIGRVRSPLADGTEIKIGASLSVPGIPVVDFPTRSALVRSRPRFLASSSALVLRNGDTMRPNHIVGVSVVLHNEGTDRARNVRLLLQPTPELRIESVDGAKTEGAAIVFGDIEASASREAVVAMRLVSYLPRGSTVVVDGAILSEGMLPAALAPLTVTTFAEPRFTEEAVLVSSPRDSVESGADIGYTLTIRNSGDGSASRLGIRIAPPTPTRYMPGTTTVNGVALLDVNEGSPLWSAAGLVLGDVAPGVEVVVRWISIVDTPVPAGTLVSCRAEIAVDEAPVFSLDAPPVSVRSVPTFPITALNLPFTIAGTAISVPRSAPPIASEPAPTPIATEPTPMPIAVEPTHTPVATEPTPTPVATEPTPTPIAAEPTPMPIAAEPTPTPIAAEPAFRVAEPIPKVAEVTVPRPAQMPPPRTLPASPAPMPAASAPASKLDRSAPPTIRPPIDLSTAPPFRSFGTPPITVDPSSSYRPAPPPRPIPLPASASPPPRPAEPPAASLSIGMTAPGGGAAVAVAVAALPHACDLSAERIERTLEFLKESDLGGLVTHLFSLRAFFPDKIGSAAAVTEALDAERWVLRSTLDRLFVKLRVPRFEISSRHIEDTASRSAVAQLFTALGSATESDELTAPVSSVRIQGSIAPKIAATLATTIDNSPIGSSIPWVGLAHLIGTQLAGDASASKAIEAYRGQLIRALERFDGQPVAEFHTALSSQRDSDLDEALQAVLHALAATPGAR